MTTSKLKGLALRSDEVRALQRDGEATVIRAVDISKLKFNPSWIGWIDDAEEGPGWYAQDVDGGQFEPAECWNEVKLRCPFGAVGSKFWVQEDWRVEGRWTDGCSADEICINRAHFARIDYCASIEWNTSIYGEIRAASTLPQSLSRFIAETTAVECKCVAGVWEWHGKVRRDNG